MEITNVSTEETQIRSFFFVRRHRYQDDMNTNLRVPRWELRFEEK
jgi:hypothetical protein